MQPWWIVVSLTDREWTGTALSQGINLVHRSPFAPIGKCLIKLVILSYWPTQDVVTIVRTCDEDREDL